MLAAGPLESRCEEPAAAEDEYTEDAGAENELAEGDDAEAGEPPEELDPPEVVLEGV